MEKAFEEQRKPEKNQRRKEKDVRRNTLFGSVRSIINFQLKKLYQNLIIKWIWHKKTRQNIKKLAQQNASVLVLKDRIHMKKLVRSMISGQIR